MSQQISTVSDLYRELSRRTAWNITAGPQITLAVRHPLTAVERARLTAIRARGSKYNIVVIDDIEAG